MNLLNQPRQSNLCGHACVAMIGDLSLEEVIDLIGRTGRATIRDLRRALYQLGYDLRPPQRLCSLCSPLCLLRAKRGNQLHMIVMEEGMIYDPAWPKRETLQEWKDRQQTRPAEKRWKIFSYWEIRTLDLKR